MLVRFRLLGHFELREAAGSLVPGSGSIHKLLLAILAMARDHRKSRDDLAALLWSDAPERNSRHSLNQALSSLRGASRTLRSILLADRELVALDRGKIRVDAVELLSWREADPPPVDLELGGTFLEGLSASGEALQEWIESMRHEIRERSISLLRAHLAIAPRAGGAEECLGLSRRILQLSPLDEPAHAEIIRAHLARGHHDLALAQFGRCRDLLHVELGVAPSAELQDLAERARSRDESRGAWVMNTPAPPDKPSLAVLPFTAIETPAFLAEGITADIIVALSRFRNLFVIARTSSFPLREHRWSDVGTILGVRYLLRGDVRLSRSKLRVTAELLEAPTGVRLWAERYERSSADVFAVQDDLTETLASTLVGRVASNETVRARRKPTGNLAAYECVLHGQFLLHRGNTGDAKVAYALFADAIEKDPLYAFAHVQLALIHLKRFFGDNVDHELDAAQRLAEAALALDDGDPWGHMVLALCHVHRRRFEAAIRHAERAAALNPNDPGIIAKLGLLLADVGRAEEAVARVERAMRLDPFRAEAYCGYLGLALFAQRRFEEALKAFEVASPARFYDHAWMAACNAHLGRREEARRHGGLVRELSPEFTIALFASREPIRNPEDLEMWLSGLRAAGLP